MSRIKRDEDEGMGHIREILTSGRYQVELLSGRSVMCYVAGMARKDKTRLNVGDRVRVELEGYHGKKGRITYRYRDVKVGDETNGGNGNDETPKDGGPTAGITENTEPESS